MAFEAGKHLRKIGDKHYLETRWRIVWFKEDHPSGTIDTEVLQFDPPLVKATIRDENGILLATGHGTAKLTKSNAVWAGREIEKAETAAIGRALGHAGYGTQFTDEDEGDHLADSPTTRQNGNKPQPQAQRQQAPQNGAGGAQKPPLANTPPTDTTAKGDGGSSAGAEFFPPEAVVLPLNTEGDSDHLPRDVNGLPILGTLDMKALGKLAQGEGLVTGQRRFANLIDVLWREGNIRAASKPEAVMEAIRQHYATKDLQREAVGK